MYGHDTSVFHERKMILFLIVSGAAGNFLCPASSLSSNAFKTGLQLAAVIIQMQDVSEYDMFLFICIIVLEIDTIGTYNTTKAIYDQYLKVPTIFLSCKLKTALSVTTLRFAYSSDIGFLARRGADGAIVKAPFYT